MTNPAVMQAAAYATRAHGSQLRKYTNEPYILHCMEVAEIVASVRGTDEQVIAALLHDTVEDTSVTVHDIAVEFGPKVAQYVEWLTDVSKPGDGNRITRKALDRVHISAAPAEVKTIKLADLLSNTRSIVEHDKKFARVYLREKDLLLGVLTEGNQRLWRECRMLLDQYLLGGFWEI